MLFLVNVWPLMGFLMWNAVEWSFLQLLSECLYDGLGETIVKKIREAEIQRVPYILVIGEKEMEANKVAVRERGKGDLGAMALEDFIKKCQQKS